MIFIQHILKLPSYRKIIFMDRDGVLNEDSPYYVRSREQIRIKDHTEDALELLTKNDIGVIIVTNQKMIGKGITTVGEAIDIHMEILEKIHYSKYSVIGSCICPHLETDNCDCRKPSAGMCDFSERVFGMGLRNTYMIGDRITDVGFAANIGAECLYLGSTSVEYSKCHRFDDLYQAVQWLVENI